MEASVLRAPATGSAAVRRRRFTLIEMLVVVAVICVLASLLMPAIQEARRNALSAACASNLRQIAAAHIMYANEFKHQVIYGTQHNSNVQARYTLNWIYKLAPFLGLRQDKIVLTGTPYVKTSVEICPSDPVTRAIHWQGSYGLPDGNVFRDTDAMFMTNPPSINDNQRAAFKTLIPFSRIKNPSDLYMVMDSRHRRYSGETGLPPERVHAPFIRGYNGQVITGGMNVNKQSVFSFTHDSNGNGIKESNGASTVVEIMSVFAAGRTFYNFADPRHGKKPHLLQHNVAYVDGHAGSVNEIEFTDQKGWVASF